MTTNLHPPSPLSFSTPKLLNSKYPTPPPPPVPTLSQLLRDVSAPKLDVGKITANALKMEQPVHPTASVWHVKTRIGYF